MIKVQTIQGNLNSSGVKIYEAKIPSKIIKLNIVNPTNIPYTVELFKYNADSGLDIFPIYKFELNAGDTLKDTDGYLLDSGDFLLGKSNSDKTLFIVEIDASI